MASNEPESTDDRLVPLIRKFLVIGCAIGVSYQAIFSLKAVHRLPHVEREGLTFVSAQKPFTHNTERRRHLSADALTHEFLQSEKGASIIPSLRKFAVDNRQPIKRIFLLGERSSETFALNEALVAAFPGYGEGKNKFYSNIPVLQHKHMFLHDLMNETELRQFVDQSTDSLYILMINNPCDWVMDIKQNPWHICPLVESGKSPACDRRGRNREVFAHYSLSDFIRMPLIDHGEFVSETTTNATYNNIFQLRAHKLRLMQQVRDVLPRNRVKVIQSKDVAATADRLILKLAKQFGLKKAAGYGKQLLSTSDQNNDNKPCLSADEQKIAIDTIDWNAEAYFKNAPGKCRTCAVSDM